MSEPTHSAPEGRDEAAREASAGEWSAVVEAMFHGARREAHEAGAVIIRKGACDRTLFEVVEGEVEIVDALEDGTEIIFDTLGPGEVLGELGFIDGRPRTRSVRCKTACVLRALDGEAIEAAPLDQQARFWRSVAHVVSRRFRSAARHHTEALEHGLESVHWAQPVRASGAAAWWCQGQQVHHVLDALRAPIEALKEAFFELHRSSGQGHTLGRADVFGWMDRLDAVLRHVGADLDAAFGRGDARVADELRDAGRFVRRELYPYLMRSTLAERLYLKPRGLALDYETLEHVRHSTGDGEGALGVLVDAWLLRSPMIRRVRARWRWIEQALRRHATRVYLSDSSGYRQIEVMVFGLGPGRELFEFARGCHFSEQLHLTCVDIDIDALRFANTQVNTGGHQAEVRFVRDSVKHMLGEDANYYTPKDIIYSLHHAEQLDDRTLGRFVARCRKLLRPGGVLMLAQSAHDAPQRVLAQSVLGVPWHYRSQAALQALVEDAFGQGDVSVLEAQDVYDLRVVARSPGG